VAEIVGVARAADRIVNGDKPCANIGKSSITVKYSTGSTASHTWRWLRLKFVLAQAASMLSGGGPRLSNLPGINA
jgi:hypothetical protein